MIAAFLAFVQAAVLTVGPPEVVGMSAERVARIDAVVTESIAKKECPGAVVLVGRHGKIVYQKKKSSSNDLLD